MTRYFYRFDTDIGGGIEIYGPTGHFDDLDNLVDHISDLHDSVEEFDVMEADEFWDRNWRK